MLESKKINSYNRSCFNAGLVFILVFLFLGSIFNTARGSEDMKTKTIKLPEPALKSTFSVEQAIKDRRSVRNYSDRPISTEQISQLLWAAQGITDERGLRAAPSAGAIYPLEVYIIKKDGLFHYNAHGHSLDVILDEDLRSKLALASWGQSSVAQASVNFVICAVYNRIKPKYKDRAVRYTNIEAGHAAQNIHLQAVALGLGSVPIGAFEDSAVAALLGVSEEETPIYIIPVGYKK